MIYPYNTGILKYPPRPPPGPQCKLALVLLFTGAHARVRVHACACMYRAGEQFDALQFDCLNPLDWPKRCSVCDPSH